MLRHPIPPCPRALPCGSPSTIPVGAVRLTTFHTCTIPEGRRPRLTAGSATSARGKRTLPGLTAYLLVHAYQPLWHVVYHDGSTAIHVRWPYPSTLAPDRLEADSRNLASRLGYPRIKRRLRCPERFAPRGYPRPYIPHPFRLTRQVFFTGAAIDNPPAACQANRRRADRCRSAS